MEAKPKRTCDEATLKRLAEMRAKANEVRKKKAELKRAEKEATKKDFEKRYEEKVLKTQTPKPVVQEETDKQIYDPPPPKPTDDGDDDFPLEMVAQRPKSTRAKPTPAPPPPPPQEPNYKQMYYQQKLSLLQSKQQEQQFYQQYARLPPYAHAVDIAKDQIKKRVDDEVLGSIYKGLFNC
jgi:hypothetical protein